MEKNKFLKVTGILMIIFSAIGIVVSIVALFGVGLLISLMEGEVANALPLYVAPALALISAAIGLIAGILGVANAAKPEKAGTCIVFGVLTALFAIAGVVLTTASGGKFNVLNLITGLALPILYLIGAFQSKKLA